MDYLVYENSFDPHFCISNTHISSIQSGIPAMCKLWFNLNPNEDASEETHTVLMV